MLNDGKPLVSFNMVKRFFYGFNTEDYFIFALFLFIAGVVGYLIGWKS